MRNRTLPAVVRHVLVRALGTVGALLVLVALCTVYARYVEPTWLRVRTRTLDPAPTVRLIHISDIHFAGDRRYLEKVVAVINGLQADAVCFTGDLLEEPAFLDDALRILATINKPVYGVPGNHDRWALRSYDALRGVFRRTGGDWLDNRAVRVPGKPVELFTLACGPEPTSAGVRRVLLEHYPEAAADLHGARFDLILAGHTHGGQVRVPILDRPLAPLDLGRYDRGFVRTPCGPMHVSPGLGTYYWPVRFFCRPEVTVLEL